jgi:hypothetical protein
MKPSVITTQQLADLADLSPSFFTLHRADLPEAFDVPSASPQGGRPAKAYSLEELAEFILDRTDFLTDAECRLRVAMGANLRKRKSPMARFLDAHSMLEIGGVLEVVPRDHSLLTPELRTRVESLIKQEQDDLGKRRTARRQIRSHTRITPQETQP